MLLTGFHEQDEGMVPGKVNIRLVLWKAHLQATSYGRI